MSYQGHAPLVIIMTCFNCLGYIVGAVFFGRYLRRSRALTVPDFFAPVQQPSHTGLRRRFDCGRFVCLSTGRDMGHGADHH